MNAAMGEVKNSMILVDWGNTNLRVYRARRGYDLEKRGAPNNGIQQLKFFQQKHRPVGELYAQNLHEIIGDWLEADPQAPVIMCGVIGTMEGWVVVPYQQCPVGLDMLANNLFRIPNELLGVMQGRNVYIVPGIKVIEPDGRCYVMRSEETKAFGILENGPTLNGTELVCMPGTHCQWIVMNGAQIQRFGTFLTGEIFDVLCKHGSLSTFMDSTDTDMVSFDRGLDIALQGHDLLTDLHNVRGQKMTGHNPPASFRDYLSGVLMGHELLGAAKYFGQKNCVLVSDPGIKESLYKHAFARFGWTITRQMSAEDAIIAGLTTIMMAQDKRLAA
ncbi:MAG: 2-dehydro-3-deoxygalactonokinase [Alphaproteobacteria bacterium]